MRLLWRRYGHDFYRGAPHRHSGRRAAGLVREATGVDARPSSRATPMAAPIRRWPSCWPTTASLCSGSPRPTCPRWTCARANRVTAWRWPRCWKAGAAHKGGLSGGDVLVAIDGLRVDAPAGLELLLAQYRPGDTVTVHVFRRDELRAFRVRLAGQPALDCVLS